MQYVFGFLLVMVCCVVAQTLGLNAVGGSTLKSESNYFSSVARIQTQAEGEPKVLLLGSSLTGRLADRAAPIPGVGNIGCDGGSAVITLRALDQGILDPAPLIVVEANTLAYELANAGRDISRAISSPWFQIGRKWKNLNATARPSAFAYSWLMSKRDGPLVASTEGLPVSSTPQALQGSIDLSPAEEALVEEIQGLFARLQKRGSRVLLVMLPPGEAEGSSERRVAEAVAVRTAVPWWDLARDLPEGSVGYTDGRHMDAVSAGKTMVTLAAEADRQAGRSSP